MNEKLLRMNHRTIIGAGSSPEIFGPAFWYTLHNGAVHYPDQPTEIARRSMFHFINSLYVMVPCVSCREHVFLFVKNSNVEYVVSSRYNLFVFYVALHNYVNKRLGRAQMTNDDAKQKYGFDRYPNGATVMITYN